MTDNATQKTCEGLSLVGSRITFLVYDGEGRATCGQNLPGNASLDAFAECVASTRLSPIAGRTFGDVIRALSKSGGTTRELCDLSNDRVVTSYDVDLWRQDDGSVGVMLVDVTGQDRDSSSIRSLSLELAHRTKNVLAVVLSLATQTARRSRDYDEFKGRFFSHVDALSNAHDIIAATAWQGVEVGSVVEKCTAPLRSNTTVTVASAASCVALKPNAVQNIAIVLRELQGACEASDRVSCKIDEGEGGTLDLSWSCEGQHDSTGLWTDMLCRYAPISLDGAGEIDFRDDGFCYRLSIGTDQRA